MILYYIYMEIFFSIEKMNISIKIPAKDTVFLKYLVTFVAQKQRKAFEELKNENALLIV